MNNKIKKRKRISYGNIMLLPTNIIMLFLIALPTILVIWLSFIDYQSNLGINFWESKFILFDNYINILKDKEFIYSLVRTIVISVICLTVEFAIGLLLSSILTRNIFGKKILFPILIIPLMIPPIVIGNNFWLLFSTNGPVNQIISILINTDFKLSWFTHPEIALIPIMISEIWHWYPLTFLILFSGLASISISEIRAAEILGANEWQIFRRIKLPKLKVIIVIALIIRMMEALKIFDTVQLLTGGGPGTTTQTLSNYLFKVGFQYSRVSYISAGALIILLIALIGFSLALRTIFVKEA